MLPKNQFGWQMGLISKNCFHLSKDGVPTENSEGKNNTFKGQWSRLNFE